MNIDLGDVLSRSWQISWKHKRLWWIGMGLSFVVLSIFPLMIAPISVPILIEGRRTDLLPFLLIGFVVVFFLFNLIIYIVSSFAQTAITLGVWKANQGEENLSLTELLRNSLPFFWRVVGAMFLFAIGLSIIMVAIQALIFLITILTFGFGAICATPLTILIYPLIFLVTVWQEQTIEGIIVDNLAVMDAIEQGWKIARGNLMAIFLLVVVVYFGAGMIASLAILPMMAPIFVIAFSFISGDPNWTIILVSVLFGAAFAPLFALINGWSLVFTKSAMVLTYLRLTRPTAIQPELQEATS